MSATSWFLEALFPGGIIRGGETLPVTRTSISKVVVLGPWYGSVYIVALSLCCKSKKSHVAKMKPSKPLKLPVAVVKLSTGVEVRAGLRLISRAPSAGVQPEPTWSCISNQLDLLYPGAEPLLGSDPDQSERYAWEERLNSGDLAAQDKTTCILALLPGISGVHLGPILQWTHISAFRLERKRILCAQAHVYVCVHAYVCCCAHICMCVTNMCFWWVNIDLHFK